MGCGGTYDIHAQLAVVKMFRLRLRSFVSPISSSLVCVRHRYNVRKVYHATCSVSTNDEFYFRKKKNRKFDREEEKNKDILSAHYLAGERNAHTQDTSECEEREWEREQKTLISVKWTNVFVNFSSNLFRFFPASSICYIRWENGLAEVIATNVNMARVFSSGLLFLCGTVELRHGNRYSKCKQIPIVSFRTFMVYKNDESLRVHLQIFILLFIQFQITFSLLSRSGSLLWLLQCVQWLCLPSQNPNGKMKWPKTVNKSKRMKCSVYFFGK